MAASGRESCRQGIPLMYALLLGLLFTVLGLVSLGSTDFVPGLLAPRESPRALAGAEGRRLEKEEEEGKGGKEEEGEKEEEEPEKEEEEEEEKHSKSHEVEKEGKEHKGEGGKGKHHRHGEHGEKGAEEEEEGKEPAGKHHHAGGEHGKGKHKRAVGRWVKAYYAFKASKGAKNAISVKAGEFLFHFGDFDTQKGWTWVTKEDPKDGGEPESGWVPDWVMQKQKDEPEAEESEEEKPKEKAEEGEEKEEEE